MAIVFQLQARWILDSRGIPTISCKIGLDQNGKKAFGNSSVPSGASTGTHEALELRDKGKEFGGKGVNQAIDNILHAIGEKIISREFVTATDLDKFVLDLDKTGNKSQLGANAILAISMASHRAFASLYNLDLWQYLRRLYFSTLPAVTKYPRLMCNIINGGQHADNALAIQEFMIVPNTTEIESDIQLASEVYQVLKKRLKKAGQSTGLGDEGGFAPNINSTKEALDFIKESVTEAGYNNLDCDLAMDAAASEFYNEEKKVYLVDGKEFSTSSLVDFYADLKENYNIISIEDSHQEDDLIGWGIMTKKLGSKIHIVGDDLFVTNVERFKEIGLEQNIANAVLIKLNQIGSVLETCEMINLAKENNYVTIVSHRSGETTDDFISDLAFASQSEFIKLGAPARGERVAKYNRLLEIKENLE